MPQFTPFNFFHYFLRRKANQFFISIAIRSLALGMILIFEPVYLYNFFDNSLSLTVLFLAASHGLYALLAVFGGKLMARIGLKRCILFSHFLFFSYYLCLFLFSYSSWFVPLAVILSALARMFFWPSFYTDFARFSERNYQGREVGKINVVSSLPAIIAPGIGGAILGTAGYPALFSAVLVALFASAIPMLLSKETHVVYTDSYEKSWQRMLNRKNLRTTFSFAAISVEHGTDLYLWPIFMFVLAISYESMGGIITFSLLVASFFCLYMGRVCDALVNRIWFLNVGSVLTAMTWVIKYFVITPLDALLAHTLYRICRSAAAVPFQTFFYEKTSLKGKEADEFVVYHEIVVNLARFLFLMILAGVFLVFPQVNFVFLVAAVLSLGLMFLGVPPKLKIRNKK